MSVPNPTAASSNGSKLALSCFVIYTLSYTVFVFLNAFYPDAMDTVVVAGLNLAIVYGFGLIGLAMLLSLIYGFARRGDRDAEATQ